MYLVKYTIKRLVMLIPVILGVTLILYFVMSLAPGNPARQILGADARRSRWPPWSMRWGSTSPSSCSI